MAICLAAAGRRAHGVLQPDLTFAGSSAFNALNASSKTLMMVNTLWAAAYISLDALKKKGGLVQAFSHAAKKVRDLCTPVHPQLDFDPDPDFKHDAEPDSEPLVIYEDPPEYPVEDAAQIKAGAKPPLTITEQNIPAEDDELFIIIDEELEGGFEKGLQEKLEEPQEQPEAFSTSKKKPPPQTEGYSPEP